MPNIACVFLKNNLNLPVTEGHFVVISTGSEDLPWLQSDAATFQCYESEVPVNRRFSFIVGQIKGYSESGTIMVEFYLPLNEFLPRNANSRMSINSGPCAGIKELIKTPYIGCVKNVDVIDLAFVFSPLFLENVTHAVVAGMENVFICRYMFKDKNRVHDDIPVFASFVVLDLFDDPFPKRVWDGIIVVQELFRSLLSTYSAKQGDYFHSTKKVNFPADVWKYLSAIRFDGHAKRQFITKTSTVRQRLDDGIIAKSMRDIRPAIQYRFQSDIELCAFRSIFGRTTTFGECSRRPMVGETKYLQHFDIINVIVPSSPEAVEAGKENGVALRFDGKDLVIKVYYHKYIYRNTNRTTCPCPVLNAAITYSATVAAANHGASVLQIDSLFCVNDMILEITAVRADHVEASIISPPLRMGKLLQYDREFVAERIREYIHLI